LYALTCQNERLLPWPRPAATATLTLEATARGKTLNAAGKTDADFAEANDEVELRTRRDTH
jgi:hypothetical protein